MVLALLRALLHTFRVHHTLGCALRELRVEGWLTPKELAKSLCVVAAPLLAPAHMLSGNLGGDVLPGWVVMCSQVDLSLRPLAPSPCHLNTPCPAPSRPHSVWTLRLKGGVSPQGKFWLPGDPLSVLPARGLVSVRWQGRQPSCHCASKEVDAWVNTQKQCQ